MRDRQWPNALVGHPLWNVGFGRLREVEFASCCLDGNLPGTGRGEEYFLIEVGDDAACSWGDPFWIPKAPQPYTSIEQIPQAFFLPFFREESAAGRPANLLDSSSVF